MAAATGTARSVSLCPSCRTTRSRSHHAPCSRRKCAKSPGTSCSTRHNSHGSTLVAGSTGVRQSERSCCQPHTDSPAGAASSMSQVALSARVVRAAPEVGAAAEAWTAAPEAGAAAVVTARAVVATARADEAVAAVREAVAVSAYRRGGSGLADNPIRSR